jgi:hypothetical protein
MNITRFVFLLAGLVGCVHRPTLGELSIPDIEQMAFRDAYRLWRQETDALTQRNRQRLPQGSFFDMPLGATDPTTGKFTPNRIAALQCRLGQEAHRHEVFLRRALAEDANVWVILESSRRLCQKYGIFSLAPVLFIPGQGYVPKMNNGCCSQAEQALWLKAMRNGGSQPDGASN